MSGSAGFQYCFERIRWYERIRALNMHLRVQCCAGTRRRRRVLHAPRGGHPVLWSSVTSLDGATVQCRDMLCCRPMLLCILALAVLAPRAEAQSSWHPRAAARAAARAVGRGQPTGGAAVSVADVGVDETNSEAAALADPEEPSAPEPSEGALDGETATNATKRLISPKTTAAEANHCGCLAGGLLRTTSRAHHSHSEWTPTALQTRGLGSRLPDRRVSEHPRSDFGLSSIQHRSKPRCFVLSDLPAWRA
jgi:hypothetical protein